MAQAGFHAVAFRVISPPLAHLHSQSQSCYKGSCSVSTNTPKSHTPALTHSHVLAACCTRRLLPATAARALAPGAAWHGPTLRDAGTQARPAARLVCVRVREAADCLLGLLPRLGRLAHQLGHAVGQPVGQTLRQPSSAASWSETLLMKRPTVQRQLKDHKCTSNMV